MNPFESCADRYDNWFVRHEAVYLSEVNALRAVMLPLPPDSRGLEIGTGTGRFSTPFGIADGIEPASAMRTMAQAKGIRVVKGVGESLPFEPETYDLVLMVTTICFVADPLQCCREAWRVLKSGGQVVIGFVDKESVLGRRYELHQADSPFYRNATFYSVAQIEAMLTAAGFAACQHRQTLFHPLGEIRTPEPIMEGHGRGGFVAVGARKDGGCRG